MISIIVEKHKLEEAFDLLKCIPEFENIPTMDMIRSRLDHVPHLVLTAHSDQMVVGCKIGYERDGKFYSWLGAVLPDYRSQGVASTLADEQEAWARQQGFIKIWMKTRNCFPQMIQMAVSRGYMIVGFDPREMVGQHRIIFEKSL
jgi:predicted GNAT superfamily acetyltransferase